MKLKRSKKNSIELFRENEISNTVSIIGGNKLTTSDTEVNTRDYYPYWRPTTS